jgi:RNA 2',3'-cyclic 3'-phosphodiesterase
VRLFIAVELDEAAKNAIAREQKRIAPAMRESRSTLKWVKRDQMHLTLVFLGEVAEERASIVVEAVERPLAQRPFELAFGGLGTFPSQGAPRVLWLAILDGAKALVELQREMADRAAGCGIALESRPFSPHLTLGRWRESRPSDRRAALGSPGPSVVARVHVEAATLFHSRLSSSGSTHTPLARATLSG